MSSRFDKVMAVAKKAQTCWSILGIVLVLVLMIEGVSQGVMFFARHESPSVDPRVHADAYGSAPWVKAYYKEFHLANRLIWHPYFYWRCAPFRGEYVNIDSDGLRRTWQPEPSAMPFERPGMRVFMFGGSTLWGTGARDDHTIPSCLARLFTRELKRRIEVVNFGDSGYVSTQEVVMLIRELQRGNVPDVVIFYDGMNDTFSAFQNRRAGIPQNESNRVDEFNILNYVRGGDLDRVYLSRLTKRPAACRIINAALRRLAGSPDERQAWMRGSHAPDPSSVAGDVVRLYASNLRIVQDLGKGFGFDAVFFWQPMIFNKAKLTAYELTQMNDNMYVKDFYDLVYGRISSPALLSSLSGFHNVSDIFADRAEPLFIDLCHISEAGNEMIAARIFREVSDLVRAKLASKVRGVH
jgi:hypothetical protein